MIPWPIRRVTDLPRNAKFREMQHNTHGLVQLIRAATPEMISAYPQLNGPLNLWIVWCGYGVSKAWRESEMVMVGE